MPLLNEVLIRAMARMVGGWAALFGLSCAIVGDKLTSQQWTYLMSVPGGKWSWAVLFLTGAVLMLVGSFLNRDRLAGIGWGVVGFGCTIIAGFYFLAPLAKANLFTLGYYPWILCSVFIFIGMKLQLRQ